VHLGYLGTIAYHAITRFQKAQAVALATALDRSTFERLVTPSEHGGSASAVSGSARLGRWGSWPPLGVPSSPSRRSPRLTCGPS
jgi:hypothetical protein